MRRSFRPLLGCLLGLALAAACGPGAAAQDAPANQGPTAPAKTEPDPPAPSEPAPAAEIAPIAPTAEARFEEFTVRSDKLSKFWNEDIEIRAMVVLPPGLGSNPAERVPVVFHVHGFGGNHRMSGARFWSQLEHGFDDGSAPRMLYVFLDASFRTGHHVFADSANNGPWGAALTEEFVPALARRYPVVDAPHGRFLTGHSSGGWSTLWLQVAYPEFFGGTWPTAPDPVDFRNFTGTDLYAWDDAYRDPEGNVTQLWRQGDGWRYSFEEFARKEAAEQPVGGQLYSFDAVFSQRRADGTPAPMFDRETGKIDHAVVETWKPYDISLVLREHWAELGPKLAGKLHVIVGTRDTFRLDESCRLLDAELERLGSPDRVLFVEGRDHGDLSQPHPEHYPDGLYPHIFAEMWASYERAAPPALREAG